MTPLADKTFPASDEAFPAPGSSILSSYLLALAVAIGASLIAYENGAYDFGTRATLTVVVWWTLAFSLLFGWREARSSRSQKVVAVSLLGFALWTLASSFWSPSLERTVDAFNLVSLYAGTFLLLTRLLSLGNRVRYLDGLTLASVVVVAIALVSRFAPNSFSDHGVFVFLPGEANRLGFPLGYWNGLAIFLAVSLPLVLRVAVVASNRWLRASAVAAVPAFGSAIYLTSSRTGSLAAAVGVLVFVLLSGRRWSVAIAAGCGLVGSVAMYRVLEARDALANGPAGSDLATQQGHEAAVALVGVCLITAAVFTAVDWIVLDRWKPSRTVGRIVVACGALLSIASIIIGNPAERFRAFKQPLEVGSSDYVQAHLFSGSGNGRWQLWSSAVDQWRDHKLLGGGAGTFEQWWASHSASEFFVKNAHSLYAEVLGELGPVGLVLLVVALGTGLLAGTRSALVASGSQRELLAASTAGIAAYCLSAGMDWIWQLPVVTLMAVALLAIVGASGSSVTERSRLSRVASLVWTTCALGFVLVAGFPLLAHGQVEASQAAVRRGDLARAADDARRAFQLVPWFSSPRVQVALVAEARGDLRGSLAWVISAIDHAPDDWRLWLIRSRIEAEMGDLPAARASFDHAIRLNPSSRALRNLAPSDALRTRRN